MAHNVLLKGKKYPVTVAGTGEVACVCIGIGTLMLKTLSERFKKQFTIYSTDLYWVENNRLEVPTTLTMEQIVDDIATLLLELKLEKVVLLAHSCFGICALEVAKRPIPQLQGIMLVASPPCWNQESIAFANAHFEKQASPERKANDAARKAHFEKIRGPFESELSLNSYEACSARYWGDFNISQDLLIKLWENITPEEAITNHFYLHLLPQHNLAAQIEKIQVPVVLAAGHFDFDSAPLELWKPFPKPSRFTFIDCGEVGHWPHIENANHFDTEIEKWIKEQF
jgi:proline iminopeptidase